MARPTKPDRDRAVPVSIRIPRAIYDEVQERASVRRTTLTALILEGLRLCLDTPLDPREVSVAHSMTAMQELEQLIDARVHAILTLERQLEPAQAPVRRGVGLSSGMCHTVIPQQREGEYGQDGNAVTQEQAGEPIAPPPKKRTGRQRSLMGQRILGLLHAHPAGLTAEQLRGYLSPERPIGDILSGMIRTGAVQMQSEGRRRRYVLPQQRD
jgi:hypothetical protein